MSGGSWRGKNVSDMSGDEIRAMAGACTSPAAPGPDWPDTRRAIDAAIARARREIKAVVAREAIGGLSIAGGELAAEAILKQVTASLDDIDQTVPPEEDDDE